MRLDRIAQRKRVEARGEAFDWSNFGRYYAEAHNMAMERAGG